MPMYTATFAIRLRVPIATIVPALPPLVPQLVPGSPLVRVVVTPMILKERIVRLHCELTYDGPSLEHVCLQAPDPESGIIVLNVLGEGTSFLMPPLDVAPLARHVLYHLAGMTLQAHVFQEFTEDLEAHVEGFRWRVPGGAVVPPGAMTYPEYSLFDLRGSGSRALTPDDWLFVQDMLAGKNEGAPLWKTILAEAHREREHDIRNVTLRCATALDVGMQPFLVTFLGRDKPKPLEVLRGEKGSRTPDLRRTDPNLYTELAELWCTRHAIIHLGKAEVFRKNPQSTNAQPVGPLTRLHAERFLCAVPKAIEYLTRNPP